MSTEQTMPAGGAVSAVAPASAPVATSSIAAPAPAPATAVQTATMSPTEQALRAMAAGLVDQGVLTAEQAEQSVAAELAMINGEEVAQTPTARQEALSGVNQLDPAFDRPGGPRDYSIHSVPKNASVADLAQIQEIAFDARLPKPIGDQLIEIVTASMHKPPSIEEIELTSRNTLAQTVQWWGKESSKMLGYGQRLVSEMGKKYPALIDALDCSGAGSDPRVVRQLCEHAARLYGKVHQDDLAS
ncbi:hypothetical protein [Ralstonia pseudosolanacearum]|uniref:hypothetical protein n=1 Tax=Ralstonia pseudosolanacearum TaxID=1310165 RepID=UPI001FFA1FB7|nr:hypothetical protein [Ralstonia pseudosolanacearum]